ncbi:septum formation initiator family protein [Patescibacteria group bacterium]|nr:septum formation initiator family protein [Patescibacteria group bacterium]
MSSHFSNTSSVTKIIIIIEFLLVAYLLYSLTKNIYTTYQIDKYIETFETENMALEVENLQKTEDFLYFTSQEYIDKIAKQNLGLINPGEEVLIISPDVFVEAVGSDEDELGYAVYSEKSNLKKWWNFFFE